MTEKIEIVGGEELINKINLLNEKIEEIKKLQQEIAEVEIKILINGNPIDEKQEDV